VDLLPLNVDAFAFMNITTDTDTDCDCAEDLTKVETTRFVFSQTFVEKIAENVSQFSCKSDVCATSDGDGNGNAECRWTTVRAVIWLRPGATLRDVSLSVFAAPGARRNGGGARSVAVRNVELHMRPLIKLKQQAVQPRSQLLFALTPPLALPLPEAEERARVALESEFVHLNA